MGVAGYYRVSMARPDMKAPQLYDDEIRRYCHYKDLHLIEVFSDIDHSGFKRSEERPALNEMLRRRHEFSGVVIPKLSRFGRSLKHLTQLFETFDRDGIALIFLDLGLDTSTSQGRLLRNIMGAFAEYESDVKGDYSRANRRRLAYEGRSFGVPPYGFVRGDGTNEPHPQQADVVRYIFRRYDEGASQYQIARELLARGIPTASGKASWEANKVGRLLDNPSYAALIAYEGQLLPAQWAPLVDRERWERVAARRKAMREKWSRARRPKRLLAGLVHCGDCGQPAYYTARGGGLPGRYRCPRHDVGVVCRSGGVNSTRVEELVTRAFLERAHHLLLRGNAGSFIAAKQWEAATNDERRMLLKAVISRVIILPLAPGQTTAGGRGRDIRIEWRDEPSRVEDPPVPKGVKATGMAATLARDQLTEIRAARAERSAKSRAYFDEWREIRLRHLKAD